jgi:hypothetical protein
MQNTQYVGANMPQQYQQPIVNSVAIAPKKSLKVAQTILTAVLVTLVLVLAGFAIKISVLDKVEIQTPEVMGVNSDKYSAVFLVNGQVYFGKIISNNEYEMQLKDVFFLRVDEQTATEGEETQVNEPLLSLVERSKSLHKPIDPMTLNKSQVILVEPLADDSEVITAINNIKAEAVEK